MIKSIITAAAISVITSQAFALDILCVDRNIQDGQITVHFVGRATNVSARVRLPTFETSARYATGACAAEENTTYLSLRCDELVTEDGEKYFARIDGAEAKVAKDGKILATIPCDSDKE